MRNEVISPYFQEESYKGQDVVHAGIRIPLQGYSPLDLLVKFSKSAQQRIKLPAQDDSGLKFRDMTDEDLPTLRAMWFDPHDATFPVSMDGRYGITCVHNGQILGGVIWTPQGRNLFLHQLISGDEGKKKHAPILLIWQSVLAYHEGWHSLDIGVSYNPKRYEFFKHFAVETYPIILKKPFQVPVIRLSPFRGFHPVPRDPESKRGIVKEATFVPRGSYAIYALLKHLELGPRDTVAIFKTFGSSHLSKCVTDAIERVCRWKLVRRVEDAMDAKLVLIVHEFGLPAAFTEDMADRLHGAGIKIAEDCAWRVSQVYGFSDYQIMSCQKVLDMNYGGFLVGVGLSDEFLWSIGCLDTVKREMYLRDPAFKDMGEGIRIRNWLLYHYLVKEDGMTPDDCYDYEGAIERNEWVPTVYLQKFETEEIADAIVARLEEFGIQAGRYWGEPLVYLPIHQNMTEAEVEYMWAVVKGYFNPCHDYGKK